MKTFRPHATRLLNLTLGAMLAASSLLAAHVFGMTQTERPIDGTYFAKFEKIQNGEDNIIYFELHQNGADLHGHFHTLGYGGDLTGTIDRGHFTLYAPWDKAKPFCTGDRSGDDLVVDLGWGKKFMVKPATADDMPTLPAYIPPPPIRTLPPNGLALTPPMGWNSWNHFGTSVDDAAVRRAADAMVASGMRDAGYTYVNIDDSWEGVRDANGVLQPNHKFPDMKALADYVHSKGLKIGIYSSPGPRTCGSFPGSYGHEAQDARTWAAWGFDYVKYDWCSAADIYKESDLQAIYQRMGEALQQSGRPIVYSLCEYGEGHVETWGAKAGANLWRTTGDIRDEWASMQQNGFSQNDLAFAAGPGHWNDPDMLEIGNGKMTEDEYKTHMSLWSMLAAPLIAGNDLSAMTPETKAILLNRDVIAIDQDTLGKQATRLFKHGAEDVWTKPLADGGLAVGIFNRGDSALELDGKLDELKLAPTASLRDLWTHGPISARDGRLQAAIPAHGVLLLRSYPPR